MTKLDPQAALYLEMFKQMPAIHLMEPQAVREIFAQVAAMDVEVEQVAKVEDWAIPVDQNDEINIRVYTPEGQGPFPIFIYYHGGGWVLGDLETADPSCRMIANRTDRVVVSVDYRLSPEHKFPVPVQDSYAALQWISENATAINGIASNIVVSGDSAGGNLAAAMTLLARNNNGPEIAGQVLIYPATDFAFNSASYKSFSKGFGLDRDLMIWFCDHYINEVEDKKNVYAAPLQAHDLSGLPPALVITSEYDVLRDEGFAYAKRLKEDGVNVDYICELGLVHGYFTNMAIFADRIKGTVSKIDKFLSKMNQTINK